MQKPPERKIEYITLSPKGREAYYEISKKSYFIMFFWVFSGVTLGFAAMKLQSSLFKSNYFAQKYRKAPLYIFSLALGYHGYKLMSFEKRKGIR